MPVASAPVVPEVLPGPLSSNLEDASIPAPPDPFPVIQPVPLYNASRTLVIQEPIVLSRVGVLAPEHDLVWFERIHVIPRQVDLGAVLTDQEIEVEVWNAFRRAAQRLEEITIAGPAGIEVDEIDDPPTHYPSTQSLLYTVRALADGDPRIDNLVTWIFTGIDEQGTNLILLGFRVLPWPFEWNAERPLVEKYGYLTNLLKADEDTEQRVQLRAVAKGSISFENIFGRREAQHANALLYGGQSRAWGVPLWMYRNPLLIAAAAGQSEIRVDTTNIPYAVGGLVFLWRDPFTWEVQRIAEVLSDRIVTTQPLQASWAVAGTWVLPMVIGYFTTREPFTWISIEIGSKPVSFDVEGFFP